MPNFRTLVLWDLALFLGSGALMPWALGVRFTDMLATTVAWMVVFPVFFFSGFGLIVLAFAWAFRRMDRGPNRAAAPEAAATGHEKE